jgi:ribosomal protein S18 acetylase RimI-like enzyme
VTDTWGITLRPSTPADRALLEAVYASTREAELALVEWEDAAKRAFVAQQFAAQDRHYREHYPGATLDVIEADGEPAGRLYVHWGDTDIRIMDIALLPEFRGRGIGTPLVRELLAAGRASGRRVSIHVERGNPARRLYERLGFRAVGEHGIYVLMAADPGAPTVEVPPMCATRPPAEPSRAPR